MNETTFENAQVGDRVWSYAYGWGTVTNHCPDSYTGRYPIVVKFDTGSATGTYTKQGKFTTTEPQTLFWDEIPIIAPPRPKRLVTKTAEVWINVYGYGPSINFFSSEEAANEIAGKSRIACVKLTGSYEVEE
jgi:hypothetical protein